MFLDRVDLYVKAGDGGSGCNSFYKYKGNRRRKPDGGPGGDGGDVYIVCDSNITTLIDFYYKKHFHAPPGRHGGGNNKKGKDGDNIFITVPPGTIVKDTSSQEIIKDFCTPGDEKLVAKGGSGGRGNCSKGSAQSGEKGQQKSLQLELKLIAEVGLVGLPNAGKSTFISHVTNAKSKTANYPFTTKNPVLGTLKLDYFDFVIADIPGLIEGAHKGKGLGDQFLRHIERTKVLVLMIDVSNYRWHSPLESYNQLLQELKWFKKNLGKKTRIIALNKIDQLDKDLDLSEISKSINNKEDLIYPISSITGEGINDLVSKLKEILEREEDEFKKAGDKKNSS